MNGAVAASAAADDLGGAIVRIHRAGPALRDVDADVVPRQRRAPLARTVAGDSCWRRMPTPERSVLHVLPHPGGGGETYVDLLERDARLSLQPSPPGPEPDAVTAAARAWRRQRLATWSRDMTSCTSTARWRRALCLPLLVTNASVVTLHGLHLLAASARCSPEGGSAQSASTPPRRRPDDLRVQVGARVSECGRRARRCEACADRPQRCSPSASRERRPASPRARGARRRRVGAGRDLGRVARRAQGPADGHSRRGASLSRTARRRRRAAPVAGRAGGAVVRARSRPPWRRSSSARGRRLLRPHLDAARGSLSHSSRPWRTGFLRW